MPSVHSKLSQRSLLTSKEVQHERLNRILAHIHPKLAAKQKIINTSFTNGSSANNSAETDKEPNGEDSSKRYYGKSVTTETWFNVLGLLVLSQLTSVTKLFSIYRNHISSLSLPQEASGKFKNSKLNLLFSISQLAHSLGFFVAKEICSQFGIKNTTLISAILISLGSGLAALSPTGSAPVPASQTNPGLLNILFDRKLFLHTVPYSIMSIGSGMMDRSAFINMVQNFFTDQERLMIALYLTAGSIAPLWQSPVITYLIRKFGGFRVTCILFSLLCLLSLPLITLISVNRDLPTKKLDDDKAPAAEQLNQKMQNQPSAKTTSLREYLKLSSYVMSLIVLFSGKNILQAQTSASLESCVKLSPVRAALVSGLGSAFSLASRIGLFDFFLLTRDTNRKTAATNNANNITDIQVLESDIQKIKYKQTDYLMMSILILTTLTPLVAVVGINSKWWSNSGVDAKDTTPGMPSGSQPYLPEQVLFSGCTLILQSALAMTLPLLRQMNQTNQKIESIQTAIPLLGALAPAIIGIIKEKFFPVIFTKTQDPNSKPAMPSTQELDSEFYQFSFLAFSAISLVTLIFCRLTF